MCPFIATGTAKSSDSFGYQIVRKGEPCCQLTVLFRKIAAVSRWMSWPSLSFCEQLSSFCRHPLMKESSHVSGDLNQKRCLMKSLSVVAGFVASLGLVLMFGPVYSQTPSPSPPAAGEQAEPAAPTTSAATSKRAECQASTQSLKGQDRRDQMQLCIAQARLDCLKQAIDKKVDGPQRRDFIRSCVGGGEEPM
jgi:hypothetical protein